MEKQNEEEGYALLQTATYFTYLSTVVIAVCMVVRSKSIGDVFVKISIVKISVEKVVAARSVLLAWRIIKIIEQEIFYLFGYQHNAKQCKTHTFTLTNKQTNMQ